MLLDQGEIITQNIIIMKSLLIASCRYIITDAGLAPEKTVTPSMLRKELCVVAFEFDSGGLTI